MKTRYSTFCIAFAMLLINSWGELSGELLRESDLIQFITDFVSACEGMELEKVEEMMSRPERFMDPQFDDRWSGSILKIANSVRDWNEKNGDSIYRKELMVKSSESDFEHPRFDVIYFAERVSFKGRLVFEMTVSPDGSPLVKEVSCSSISNGGWGDERLRKVSAPPVQVGVFDTVIDLFELLGPPLSNLKSANGEFEVFTYEGPNGSEIWVSVTEGEVRSIQFRKPPRRKAVDEEESEKGLIYFHQVEEDRSWVSVIVSAGRIFLLKSSAPVKSSTFDLPGLLSAVNDVAVEFSMPEKDGGVFVIGKDLKVSELETEQLLEPYWAFWDSLSTEKLKAIEAEVFSRLDFVDVGEGMILPPEGGMLR